MNTACTGPSSPSNSMSPSNESTWRPKALRRTVISMPPQRQRPRGRARRRRGSRWPAGSSRHTNRRRACRRPAGRRSGSSSSNSRSRWLIVVDSPPGITRASTASSSPRRRTVTASAPASRSAARCSRVSPCRASTPTRTLTGVGGEVALVAGQPLLHHRRDHLAVLVEDLALGQRAATARRRRGLVVEQPLVGAERPHEPHRVIQRGDHQVLAFLGVVDLRRTQQRQVAHVGQRADVQHVVVGQRVAVPEPHLLLGRLAGQSAFT